MTMCSAVKVRVVSPLSTANVLEDVKRAKPLINVKFSMCWTSIVSSSRSASRLRWNHTAETFNRRTKADKSESAGD